MILLGTVVNTAAVALGAGLGLLLGKAIPERFGDSIMKGLGLCTFLIAIGGLSESENILVTIISVIVGVVIGEALRLDDRLNALGDRLQARMARKTGPKSTQHSISEGFVTASLLFCVGAMTIMGAIQGGLSNEHSIYFTKATLDFISALILASGLGFGVVFSSVSVFIVQGSLTLLAALAAPYLQSASGEMNCVGSLLLIALSLNLMGVGKFKVMNYVPAIFLPVLLCLFM